MKCKGNGETATALVDIATGEIAGHDSKETDLREIDCTPDACPKWLSGQCRRVMSLQVLLGDVKGFGIWQIDTSSIYSIININSALDLVRRICGRINMIPMELVLAEQEVSPEGKKKNVHILTINVPCSLSEMQNIQLPRQTGLTLPSPDTEIPDEFFPDAVIADTEKKAEAGTTKKAEEGTRKKKSEPKEIPAKTKLLAEIKKIADSISDVYFETNIRQRVEQVYHIATLSLLEDKELQEILDTWLNKKANDADKKAYVIEMKRLGYTDKDEIKSRLTKSAGSIAGWTVADLERAIFTANVDAKSTGKPDEIDDFLSSMG